MAFDTSRYHCRITSGAESKDFVYKPEPEERQSLAPRPTRQDMGNNPNEIRPEYGDFFAQGEFSGGAGQQRFHRKPIADETAYLYDYGCSIEASKGTVSLGPDAVEATGFTITGTPAFVEANGKLFWIKDANAQDVAYTTDLSTSTTENILTGTGEADAGSLQDLTSDGDRLFAGSLGNGVHVRTTAGTWDHLQPDGSTDLTPVYVYNVFWSHETARLIMVAAVSAGGAKNVYEVIADSTPTIIHTIEAGWIVTSITEVNGHIYIATRNTASNRGVIHFYGLNSDASAIIHKGTINLASNEFATSLLGYLGLLFVITETNLPGSKFRKNFYVGTPGATGHVSILKQAQAIPTTAAQGHAGITAQDAEVRFHWLSPEPGSTTLKHSIARYDIATGAFYPGHFPLSFFPTRIVLYNGQLVVARSSSGSLFSESATVKASTSTLWTSLAEWNNAGNKSWDLIEIIHKPMPGGASIQVYYSTKHPDDNSWTLAGTSSTGGAEGAAFDLSAVSSRIFALKFVLNRATDTTLGPEVLGFSVRSLPSPDAEWVFARTIRLALTVEKGPGAEPAFYNSPRDDKDWLKSKLYSRITLEEPDETFSARVESVGIKQVIDPDYIGTASEQDFELWEVTLGLVASET